MDIVKFGKVWDIKTAEDFQKALDCLAGNDICADMSDDWQCTLQEKAEIAKQRKAVYAQAAQLGLIKG